MVLPPGLHLEVDGPGHDVPRGQIAAGVVVLHELLAVQAAEHRALPAQGLGDEEPLGPGVIQAGGVELDELQVRHPRPGPVGHRHAVPGGDVRVGGVQVHLPATARSQDGGLGLERDHRTVVGGEDVGPPAGFAVLGGSPGHARGEDQVHGEEVLQHGDVAAGGHRGQERLLHRGPGAVGGVDDASLGVAAFATQLEVPVAGAAELDPHLHQLPHQGGTLFDHHLHHVGVAEPRPRDEGVPGMEVGVVLGIQDRGDPPLGVVGVGLRPLLLRDHGNRAPLAGLEGAPEAGQSRADDQGVGVAGGFDHHGGAFMG